MKLAGRFPQTLEQSRTKEESRTEQEEASVPNYPGRKESGTKREKGREFQGTIHEQRRDETWNVREKNLEKLKSNRNTQRKEGRGEYIIQEQGNSTIASRPRGMI